MLFKIRDEGKGIHAEELPFVFNWVYSSKSSAELANAYRHAAQGNSLREIETSNLKLGGWGMGLPMCRAFARNLGGDIWLESKEGEGTTAYLKLPSQQTYFYRDATSSNKKLEDAPNIVEQESAEQRTFDRYMKVDDQIKRCASTVL